ncbi:DUF4406 domain-containing protein [Aminobacterium colombiense]|uniref:DUF4406 domain-containing protein n=1 Tax=Aminobacterium colombiense (strain DSM 12261 / ALA-1) TaxID=572547 RepID=D5EFC5_AMICL|nr:DUF4406 domain-containing protein [Aminobacterium colombiense]ADE57257.1 hypothetical protein Amico_1134 [Aminobacterium colombiense DSM 12261]
MKKIYIAHPLRGKNADIETVFENNITVDTICQNLSAIVENKDILILSPVHAFSFVSAVGDQKWVLGQCRKMLSLADEIWVFGDWENSEGCKIEIEHAKKLNIPIIFHGSETKDLYECLA